VKSMPKIGDLIFSIRMSTSFSVAASVVVGVGGVLEVCDILRCGDGEEWSGA
jgi:hypothetical protein